MSDEFTRGFLEGVEVAARIFRNLVESEAARDKTMKEGCDGSAAQVG